MAGRIAYYGNIVTSGLVLNLDAAKRDSYPGSGTTWRDISGNSNNGTLTNGPTFNSDNYGSIAFDGVDDYVLLPNGLLSGTGDFTVNQFIKPNGSVVGTTFGNFSTGNLQVLFGTNYIGMWLDNNSTYLINPLSQYTTNPVMITASRNGTTTYFHINGVLQKTGSSSSTIGTPSSQFRLGTNTATSETYNGGIYTTQIYNRALSPSEILQNYNATKTRYGL